MNKKVLRLLFTFLFMFCVASYAMLDLYSFRNNIVMDTKIVKGEKIKDSNIKLHLTASAHKGWNVDILKTSFQVDENDKINTKFIHDNQEQYKLEIWHDNLPLHVNGGHGTSATADEASNEKNFALKEVSEMGFADFKFQQNIFKKMIINNKTNKTIKLKDYINYIPISIDANKQLRNNNFIQDEDKFGRRIIRIDDYFKFPVKDDMKVACMIKYDYNKYGESFDIDVKLNLIGAYSEQDNLFEFMNTYDKNEEKLFLCFEDGKNYKIPEKYKGVFTLPLHKEKNEEFEDETIYEFDTIEIKQAYQPQDKEVIEKILCNNANELCVLSRIDKAYKLTYIDKDSLKVIASLDINFEDKSEYIKYIRIGENGLIVTSSKQNFTWIDDNSHKILLQGKINKSLGNHLKEGAYTETQFDYIFSDNKLYTLEHNGKLARLGIITNEGYQNIVEYSFPLKRTSSELSNNDIRQDSFYKITEASLSIGGDNEQ